MFFNLPGFHFSKEPVVLATVYVNGHCWITWS